MAFYTIVTISKKTKKIILFTIVTKNKNGNKLPRNKCNQYSENYKAIKKETEEYTNKWKYILYSWTGRINTIKMPLLPEAI